MHHRIHLDLEIRFISRWHAGSGERSFTIDRLVRRDAQNRPFIPASTLKGIVRQSCEKLSRSLGFPEPSDPHQADLTQSHAFIPFDQMASPIDQLFGTKFEPGGLFFRDAHLKDNEDCSTFSSNRVARYRVLNTARDKHLFSTEYGLPATFQTRVDGWHSRLAHIDKNDPPYAYCLLIAGILAVERIGGDKSIGAGWLDTSIPIVIQNAVYNGSPVNMDDVFVLLDPALYIESRGEA
jgi:hypothetical protein